MSKVNFWEVHGKSLQILMKVDEFFYSRYLNCCTCLQMIKLDR